MQKKLVLYVPNEPSCDYRWQFFAIDAACEQIAVRTCARSHRHSDCSVRRGLKIMFLGRSGFHEVVFNARRSWYHGEFQESRDTSRFFIESYIPTRRSPAIRSKQAALCTSTSVCISKSPTHVTVFGATACYGNTSFTTPHRSKSRYQTRHHVPEPVFISPATAMAIRTVCYCVDTRLCNDVSVRLRAETPQMSPLVSTPSLERNHDIKDSGDLSRLWPPIQATHEILHITSGPPNVTT